MRVALTTRSTVAGLAALSLAALAVPATAATAAPAEDSAAPPTASSQTYIVTLRHGSLGRGLAGEVGMKGAKVRHVYENVFQGFAAQLTPGLVAQLRVDRRIASVEPDSEIHVDETIQKAPPWGLDRIDQRDLPLSSTYTYTANGAGVTAYVLDTGVRSTHAEFTGRVSPGFDAVGGTSSEDCHGHGTHVAGTVGGTTYGVAKGVKIVPVRIMRCDGSGSWSDAIMGLDWVAAQHSAGSPAVAVMSMGGAPSSGAEAAVQAVVADGVVVAVSAGNGGADACGQSPARVPEVLTTGATDSTDTRRSTSNYGSCVDVFAPGASILSSVHTSDTATAYKSGTSMAAPHVAGAAAVYLQSDPAATTSTVSAALINGATSGLVKSAGTGSPNTLLRLVSSASTPIVTPTEPAPITPAPVTAPSAIRLSVSISKRQGTPYGFLSWSGANGANVDVWRDGRRTAVTANDGDHSEAAGSKGGGGRATYKVCEGATTTCSPDVTVTW